MTMLNCKLDNNNLPFIEENLVNKIVKLKSFIHNNIYANSKANIILENIIKESFDPFNIELEMDRHFKTINLKLKKTNINIKKLNIDGIIDKYNSIGINILENFFANEYIKELLSRYDDLSIIYKLQDKMFLNLLFSTTVISDNLIKIYL